MGDAFLDRTESWLAVLEAEHAVIMAETDAGLSVPDARRPLFRHEVRAGVRFGDIAETYARAEKLVTEAITAAKQELLSVLGGLLPSGGSREVVLARLTELELSPPEELRVVVERLAAALDGVFADVWVAGRDGVRWEAQSQGVDVLSRPSSRMARQAARRSAAFAVAAGLFRQAMQSAVDAANDPRATSLIAAVLGAVEKHEFKGVVDQARQETHVEHGSGRWAGLDGLPDPEYAYAGELLDSNTCDKCAAIDGYQFADLAEAERYYPQSGPMVACRGGFRCRGTLVIEFVPDAPDDEGLPEPPHRPELPRLD